MRACVHASVHGERACSLTYVASRTSPYVVLFLQVGFDDSGRISGIMLNMYSNSGYVDNDNTFAGDFLYGFIDNGLCLAVLIRLSCKGSLLW